MPTNLTDRLGELVDKVTPEIANGRVSAEAAESLFRAGWAGQRPRALYEPNYAADAELFTLLVNNLPEILSALRKAEALVTGDYAELVERLRDPRRDGAHGLRAEAATEIERLTAEVAGLLKAVQVLRNGYTDAVGGYHYIIQRYGRLAGVGFDRVIDHYDEQVTIPEREGLLAGSHVISARLSLGDEK